MSKITIEQAKTIREYIGATHVVVFAIDESGNHHVATHGATQVQAKEAAKAGNKLKKSLGWPDDLCKSVHLKRICKNCVFYNPDFGIHCFNGWTGDGSKGWCTLEPKHIGVAGDNKCCHFEPNA